MKDFLYFIFRFLFKAWVKKGQRDVVSDLKAKSLVTYLHILNGARMSVMGMVTVLLILQMVSFGLALMIGAAVFLAPFELNLKLWIVFAVGGFLFVLPILGISLLLSQRLWYRLSGAEKMVSEVLEKQA